MVSVVVTRARVLALAIAGLITWWNSASATAEPLRIKVRGTTKITARAARDQGELVLSGSLGDDAAQPLAAQPLAVRVTREADPNDAKVADALRAARGCERSADRPRPAAAWAVTVRGSHESPEVVLTTDEDGRFCFRAKLEPDRFIAHLHWRDSRPGSLLDPAALELPFDLSRRSLALSFDPRPRVVSLDAPDTTFDALAIVDDDATPRVGTGLLLTLSTEDGKPLATATTNASGRARFNIPANHLGAPGHGELRLTFPGDGETAKATHAEPIERRVKVAVRVPAAERGELVPRVPEDGIPLVAEVTAVSGPVSEGAIEAHVGDVIVGAAPVERGIARLTLTFAAQGTETAVALRYVPSSPWYEPLPEPTVRIPIRGPGLMAKAPILLAGLAVLAFFLLGRVSSKQAKPEPQRPKPAPGDARDGKPGIEVVRPAARGETKLSGRIVDAHEGTSIEGARVWVERGTFEGRTTLASAVTGADGRFALGSIAGLVGGERILAEGRYHARVEQPLPSPGEITIALARRRRALLARLVGWAKLRGAPFDAKPEPTPGHVRRAAGDDRATAEWAEAIERAVFGDGEVDARVEREIEELAPGAPRGHERAPGGDDGT